MIARATCGFCSKKAPSRSFRSASTWPLTSELPSFVLVCPSNWGFGILTEMTALRPSRTSSPWSAMSFASFPRFAAAR
jgi:hypothetical protein